MNKWNHFWEDTGGDAAVEASILFPIIIMIFAGLVLLSMYMPTRASLQRATQYTATALATERSDTWLVYDEGNRAYRWKDGTEKLNNVYVDAINSARSTDDSARATAIVTNIEENSITAIAGELSVKYKMINYVIYKEIIVTATRTITAPVDLSFVGFPKEIPITVTSTAVVQNGDEFVRNIDIAADLVNYMSDKYELDEKLGISKAFKSVKEFMGWI